MLLSLFFLCSSTAAFAQAAVTVYGQAALGFTNGAASDAAPAPTPAAYDTTKLQPPAIPDPAPPNAFSLTLQQDAAVVGGLSIAHTGGCFWGFSIEMSVINQVRKSNPLLDLVYLFFFFSLSFFLDDHFLVFSWQKLVCSKLIS